MAKTDYYELLGVGRDADADSLKKAYRKQAMKYHPDRNAGDDEAEHRFKAVNEAYEVLKDPEKRAAYDQFGHAAFENGGGRGGAGGAGGFGGFGGFSDIFEDIFGEFMGGGRRGGGGAGHGGGRGADLRYNMEISLEEAFNGKQATIRVPSTVQCDVCEGSGSEKGSKPVTCPTCGGAGRVRAQQGFFTIERACPTCGGAGRVIENPCGECGGAGRVRKEKSLSVNIPAGVEDGTRIRLSGEGEAGLRGAPAGDLYIFLSIAPHRLFQREGADIYCKVPIPMTTAALGGSVEVPAVDGSRTKVSIPKGTQNGDQFRLRSMGMSVLRTNARGDMYVQASVEVPVNLTKEQEELLRKFEEAGNHETNPQSHGFFSRVKEFFEDLGN